MTTITNNQGITEQPAAQQPQGQGAALQISDLQNILLIVDLASQRGAFRANELAQIGQVFDRISQFLQATLPPPAEAPAAPAAPPLPTGQTPVMAPVSTSPMTPPFAPKIGG